MNKKLTKLLSIFLIAGAIGAGAVGITACNKDNTPSHDVHIDADGDGKCDNGGEDFSATPTAITLTPSAQSVEVDGTVTLTAVVTGENGKPSQNVTYAVYEADGTTASTKATITGNVLTAVAEGTVKVVATSAVKTDVKSSAVTITIQAKTKFGEISAKSNKIISENFEGTFEGGKLPVYTDSSAKGVFARAEQQGDDADKCYVTVANGVAKTVETSTAIQVGGKNSNTHIVVNFGPVKGVVEGYFEFKVLELADPGNSVRFTSGGEDVFSIFPAANNANFKYYKGGSNNTGTAITADAQAGIASSTSTTYKTYFKFDLTAGTLTLEINGQAVFTDYNVGINALDGFYLTTSNASRRGMSVDNIAVAADAMTAADYKAIALAAITAEAAKYPAETYTLNQTAIDAAVAAANSAVNASSATLAEMQTAVATLKTTLAAVESDAKVAQLRTAAINKLGETYPAYGYKENKTAYDAAIEAAETAINAETRAAGINAAYTAAENAIKAIDSDAKILEDYQTAHEGDLAAYIPEGKEGVDTTAFADQITAAVADGNAKLEAAKTKAEAEKAIADAKAAIDKIYEANDTSVTFADFKTTVLGELAAYVEAKQALYDETEEADRITALSTVKTAQDAIINALTEGADRAEGEGTVDKTDLSNALKAAKKAIDDKVSEYAIADYYDEQVEAYGQFVTGIKTEYLHGNDDFDNAINAVAEEAEEGKDVSTIAKIDEFFAGLKTKVNAVVDAWTKENNQKLTVTFAETNLTAGKANFGFAYAKPATDPTEENKRFVGWYADAALTTPFDFTAVRYGDITIYAKWKEADVTIKLYNKADDANPLYTIKAFSGEDTSTTVKLPEEAYASGLKFAHWYVKGQDATVAYSLPATFEADAEVELVAYFSGYKPNAELTQDNYTAPASGTVSDPIVDGNLFKVVTNISGAAYYVGNCTVGGKEFTQGVQSGNITNDTKETAYTLTAKEDIKIKVYLALSDSKLGSRLGDIRYKLNGVDVATPIASEQKTKKVITGVLEIELSAGDVIDFYINNLNNGSRLYLYSVEVEISDTFTNMSVAICDANGETHDTKQVSSLKAITQPGDDDVAFLGDVAITGWSYMVGEGEWTAITDWSAVPHTPGTTVSLKPTVAVPDVTVKFYDLTDGEYAEVKTVKKLSSSQTIAEADAPAETATAGVARIGWFTKSGDKYTEYTFGSALAADSTVELYARYGATIAVSHYEQIVSVTNPSSTMPTTQGTTSLGEKISFVYKPSDNKISVTALSSAVTATVNGQTHTYASGTNVYTTNSNSNNTTHFALALTDTNKSYRVTVVWSVTGTNKRLVDITETYDKPSGTATVTKSDGVQVTQKIVKGRADGYFVGWNNKEIYIYEILIEEVVVDAKPVTGVSGEIDTSGDGVDLTKLFFNYEGGTVALSTLDADDLEVTEIEGGVKIVYKGKAEYVYAPAASTEE